ncbi:hypothetical protein Dimus_018481 [Dionaea muscipula]
MHRRVVPIVSTSATTSGAPTLPMAFTLPWTLAPNGPNGSVVRVEKPVVSVETVMIESVRTPPHPELQTSRETTSGVARLTTPKRMIGTSLRRPRPGVSDRMIVPGSAECIRMHGVQSMTPIAR